jgi:hypothetical protein
MIVKHIICGIVEGIDVSSSNDPICYGEERSYVVHTVESDMPGSQGFPGMCA